MKLEPVSVIVVVALPAAVEEGLIDASVGDGLLVAVIVNVWPAEVPPPGAGFVTVTVGVVEAEIRFAAGIVAVRLVAEP